MAKSDKIKNRLQFSQIHNSLKAQKQHNKLKLQNIVIALVVYGVSKFLELIGQHKSGLKITVKRSLIVISTNIQSKIKSDLPISAKLSSAKNIKTIENYGILIKAILSTSTLIKTKCTQSFIATVSLTRDLFLKSVSKSAFVAIVNVDRIKLDKIIRSKNKHSFVMSSNMAKIGYMKPTIPLGITIFATSSSTKGIRVKENHEFKISPIILKIVSINSNYIQSFIISCKSELFNISKIISTNIKYGLNFSAKLASLAYIKIKYMSDMIITVYMNAIKTIKQHTNKYSLNISAELAPDKYISGESKTTLVCTYSATILRRTKISDFAGQTIGELENKYANIGEMLYIEI